MAHFDTGIRHKPDDAEVHLNRALTLLLLVSQEMPAVVPTKQLKGKAVELVQGFVQAQKEQADCLSLISSWLAGEEVTPDHEIGN
jgi:hypothetical protein